MKTFGTLSVIALSAYAGAQGGELGTKADLVARQPASSAVGVLDVVQMVAAIAIVFVLLKWALPKIVSKMNKKMGHSSSDSIKLEESAMFGGCQLQIVTVRGRTLLIGATHNDVNLLADLTLAETSANEPAFFELVDKASEHAIVGDFVTDRDRIALERLSKLSI